MERHARLTIGRVFSHLVERITCMRFTSNKDRYLNFQIIHSVIFHRIPMGMVASYLGVTQETLSRV